MEFCSAPLCRRGGYGGGVAVCREQPQAATPRLFRTPSSRNPNNWGSSNNSLRTRPEDVFCVLTLQHPLNVPDCKLHCNLAPPGTLLSWQPFQWGPFFPSDPPSAGPGGGAGSPWLQAVSRPFSPGLESHAGLGSAPPLIVGLPQHFLLAPARSSSTTPAFIPGHCSVHSHHPSPALGFSLPRPPLLPQFCPHLPQQPLLPGVP